MENLKDLQQDWIKKFDKPFIIAGPCSAESEEQVMETAKQIDKSYVTVFRAGIWKPRTKPGSFEGIGEIGLKWLQKVKQTYGIPVATEIANAEHAKLALEYDVDYLWIGARSTVNPFTIQEIAEAINGTNKVVLVKNPVNPDLDLWIGALERFVAQGVKNLGVIHRGFSAYKKNKYRNNPEWQIALEFKNRYPNIPIITDPSHICGNREGIYDISQQAFNHKFAGLMIETHRNPDEAWSDANQQVTPDELLRILKKLEIRNNDDSDAIFHSKLNALRTQIDELDHQILDLINDRFGISKQIGELKKEHNVAVFQSDRWNEIIKDSKEKGAKIGLSGEFVEKLLQLIHVESVEIQNQIMVDKTTKA
ncbi:MAG: bifunctional 3-deoxy-7-phosphoheptulonate synthase/chorismate mutase type II [Flavobacteriales bacterium]|nr:bifunctional 3-deoxy-7-phosphoheptulonate synthase/chorismate mutase type II [Flavobacteriales bacterium]